MTWRGMAFADRLCRLLKLAGGAVAPGPRPLSSPRGAHEGPNIEEKSYEKKEKKKWHEISKMYHRLAILFNFHCNLIDL